MLNHGDDKDAHVVQEKVPCPEKYPWNKIMDRSKPVRLTMQPHSREEHKLQELKKVHSNKV